MAPKRRADPDVPATSGPLRPAHAVPAQLPPALAGFVGRASELKLLDGLVADATREPPTMAISVIAGSAGVGKTSLAVHWAHRVRDQFPDGQLYVNLRGFDQRGAATDPAEAVRGFLDTLAVPRYRIPATSDAQVGLYRSLLSGRRVLVVLDNASDAERVRSLLPGSPGCSVLITSRNRLTSLAVTEAARMMTLDLMSDADAYELLAMRLRRGRVAAEPDAASEIVELCARLPLALAVVAAQAAARPDLRLSGVADELRGAGQSLDPFAVGDAASDLRSVFSWSCAALSGGRRACSACSAGTPVRT